MSQKKSFPEGGEYNFLDVCNDHKNTHQSIFAAKFPVSRPPPKKNTGCPAASWTWWPPAATGAPAAMPPPCRPGRSLVAHGEGGVGCISVNEKSKDKIVCHQRPSISQSEFAQRVIFGRKDS